MICTPSKVAEGCQILTTFYLISGPLIIVRGVVRSVIPAQGKLPERYGLEFLNLSFHFKREIRNFVAAATYIDGNTSL